MNIKTTPQWREAENWFNHLQPRQSFFTIVIDAPAIADTLDETDQQLAELLEAVPQFYPAWFRRAEIMLRTGKSEEGERFLDQGFQHLSEIVTREEEFITILSAPLESLEQLLRYDLVVRVLERAVRLFPDVASFYDELAYCTMLVWPDKSSSALYYQEKALECDPDNDYFINNLGWLYLMMADYDKAEQYFTKAVDFNSQNDTAFDNLDMLEIMREKGMSYQQYLLRPMYREDFTALIESGDWEEARELSMSVNKDRLDAFKRFQLTGGKVKAHDLLGMLQVVAVYFEALAGLPEDELVLCDDLDRVLDNFNSVLASMLEQAEFMDEEVLKFYGQALEGFYEFLVKQKLVSSGQVSTFKKRLEDFIKRLAPNLEFYYDALQDVTLSEKEREQKLSAILY
jgi:tetratricopeptide (TPR) repeat protein